MIRGNPCFDQSSGWKNNIPKSRIINKHIFEDKNLFYKLRPDQKRANYIDVVSLEYHQSGKYGTGWPINNNPKTRPLVLYAISIVKF